MKHAMSFIKSSKYVIYINTLIYKGGVKCYEQAY